MKLWEEVGSLGYHGKAYKVQRFHIRLHSLFVWLHWGGFWQWIIFVKRELYIGVVCARKVEKQWIIYSFTIWICSICSFVSKGIIVWLQVMWIIFFFLGGRGEEKRKKRNKRIFEGAEFSIIWLEVLF